MANHLIAKHRLRKPAAYRETFEILSEGGVIPPDLAAKLSDLAAFRNALVHAYWRIDMKGVYNVLQNDLKHPKRFLATVRGKF